MTNRTNSRLFGQKLTEIHGLNLTMSQFSSTTRRIEA